MNRALPREIFSENGTLKRVWMILVGVAIPLLILNAVLFLYYERHQHNKGYVLVETKWNLLRAQKKPVDVLIIGDSSCNQGIDPEYFEQQTGLTAINLCTIGFMTFAQNPWILDYYLSQIGKPKYVIVTNVYDSWKLDTTILKTLAARISVDRDFWMSLKPALDVSQWSLWVQKYAPLYSQKTTNVSFTVEPSRIWNPPSFYFTDRGFMPEETSNKKNVLRDVKKQKAFLDDAKEMKTEAATDPDVEDTLNVVSEFNADALKAFAAISDRHDDVEFHLFHSPVVDALASDTDWRAYDQQMFGLVDALLGDSRVIRHFEPMVFPVSEMQNADHVTVAGAKKFSDYVAETITR